MEFKVVKGYCGIKVGAKIIANKPATIKYMVKQGYWEEVIRPIKKIEAKVEHTKREKKVESGFFNRKKK